jgi:anion-transporting  ArsA/GET3 family ATPase
MTLRTALGGAEVIVCCGSGGVGKTTTAAVLGLDAARRGRRVVVVTIDPARRLADALGLPDGLGPEPSRVPLDAPGELWAMMLDTAAMFDRVVRANAGSEEQAARIVENRFYRNIAGSLSGTQEYMASEALHQLHDDPRFDLVVVDTPPSRNALDFLEAPGVLARFLDHRVFKLLMLPTRGGLRVLNVAAQPLLRAIGKVVGSDVLADAVAFFQSFAGMDVGFRERAEAVTALLRSPTTRFLVVASPRHDTVTEAVWFVDQLHAQGLEVAAAVVNRAHPGFGTAAEPQAPVLAAMWENFVELRTLRERERAQLAPLAAGLGAAPIVEVPLLAGDVHDLDGLLELAGHLFGSAA